MDFIIRIATEKDSYLAELICQEYEESAKQRGIGISKRSPEYIVAKMSEEKAVISFLKNVNGNEDEWAGFCYIETWSDQEYVANSGLIVLPKFRKEGLAKRIKNKIFDMSRTKYPGSKIFGITTSGPVMKINSDLGYKPVTFSELTQDEKFWVGCQSCPNFDILTKNNKKMCLCTGMLFLPPKKEDERKD